MNEPGDNHTKWSKSDRKRQTSCDIACMWNLKTNDINELMDKTQRLRI